MLRCVKYILVICYTTGCDLAFNQTKKQKKIKTGVLKGLRKLKKRHHAVLGLRQSCLVLDDLSKPKLHHMILLYCKHAAMLRNLVASSIRRTSALFNTFPRVSTASWTCHNVPELVRDSINVRKSDKYLPPSGTLRYSTFCNDYTMAWCKIAVTPVRLQWSYCSLALSHRYCNGLVLAHLACFQDTSNIDVLVVNYGISNNCVRDTIVYHWSGILSVANFTQSNTDWLFIDHWFFGYLKIWSFWY